MPETTFASIDLSATAPADICQRCAEQGLEHVPTGVVFCRCRHTETSAYRNARGEWKTIDGLTAEQFKQTILYSVFVGEQRYIERETNGLTRQ